MRKGRRKSRRRRRRRYKQSGRTKLLLLLYIKWRGEIIFHPFNWKLNWIREKKSGGNLIKILVSCNQKLSLILIFPRDNRKCPLPDLSSGWVSTRIKWENRTLTYFTSLHIVLPKTKHNAFCWKNKKKTFWVKNWRKKKVK